MDLNHPFLSIIIPEKDRYKYLLPLVELIDSFKLEDTEIVIDDNSEDNTPWLEFIGNNVINTPIVYNYVKEQISMTQNYENGIRHSNGKYLCFLGDDDGVMPNILECAHWMDKNDVDCIRQKSEITYKWPAYYADQNNGLTGATLSYDKCHYVIESIDAKRAAEEVVKSGFYSLGHCPCFYHGIVSRKALDKLYKIGGRYLPGPSPDMANAIALSFVVDKFYITDIPFVISGGSEYQGGRTKKIKSWVQPLTEVPFISEEDKKAWDKRIPYIWAGTTVWPESGLKGLEYVGQEQLEENIDFDEIIARALFEVGKNYFKEVISKANKKGNVIVRCLKKKARVFLSTIKRQLVNAGVMSYHNERVLINNVMSIEEAISYLNSTYNCHFNNIKD